MSGGRNDQARWRERASSRYRGVVVKAWLAGTLGRLSPHYDKGPPKDWVDEYVQAAKPRGKSARMRAVRSRRAKDGARRRSVAA